MTIPELQDPSESPPRPGSAPVSVHDRVYELDFLRGVAILIALAANMVHFVSPVQARLARIDLWTNPLDRWVTAAADVLLDGQFYPVFAFLIGVGLALQVDKARRTGRPLSKLHLRRMGLLFLLGAAHVLLLWYGDVLILYAVLGLPLTLFLRRSPRTLVVSAVVFLVLPVLMTAGYVLQSGSAGDARQWEEFQANMQPMIERATEVYSNGTFAQITAQRVQDYFLLNSFVLMAAPMIFSMFLFGLYAGRLRLFRDGDRHARTWRILLWGGLATGAVGHAYLYWGNRFLALDAAYQPLLEACVRTLAVPGLSCFYLATARAIALRSRTAQSPSLVAAAGRASLSNYLLQSFLFTTLLYGYGGGLYGSLGPAVGLALSLVILPLLLFLSRWWLRRYRFGPVEWLWRSGTYGRWQPLLLPRSAGVDSDGTAATPAPEDP